MSGNLPTFRAKGSRPKTKTYRWVIAGDPVDLTGYTMSSTVKADVDGPTLATLVVTIDPDQTLGGNRGVFRIRWDGTTSAVMKAKQYHDLLYEPPSEDPDYLFTKAPFLWEQTLTP